MGFGLVLEINFFLHFHSFQEKNGLALDQDGGFPTPHLFFVFNIFWPLFD